METRRYGDYLWKSLALALLFACFCFGNPSVADAQQFHGVRTFKPPQIGTPPVSNEALREQWTAYYSRPSWWKAGRTYDVGPSSGFPTAGVGGVGGGGSW
ncbi:MAG: hypothetical protein V1792_16310 [Pseudomonadota bacterium]